MTSLKNDKSTRTTGRPTLKEVAQLAGVSLITASRALRDIPTVTEELAIRVRNAAEQLGYVVNPAARALASACSQSVAVIVPALGNQLFIEMLESIHQVMRPRGLELLIGNSHYSRYEEEDLIRQYLAHQPRGLLLTGFERTESARRLLEASQIPCVYMMELDSGVGLHCVGFSQVEAGAAVADHLLARQRQHIAFIGAQLDQRTLLRAEGFRHRLQKAQRYNPMLELFTPQPSTVGLGCELFAQLMQRYPQVDGIFFGNDDLAQGALLEALRMGISIPQQVSIVGFNDLPSSAFTVPRLTSIRTPRSAIGQRSAELLLSLMEEKTIPQRTQDLGFELMVRESS